ncbi:MAG: hypothetical protein HPY45_08540 [Anaerolineae bacterium]|nr:hypothetical protein [Anaerolineae bacterium]
MPEDTFLSLQPALLGFFINAPRYAYDLSREFEHDLGRVWRLGRSLMYAQLKELAEQGYLAMDVVTQPNRPARKIYYLTDAGRIRFAQWLNQPTMHIRNIRVEFLVRLYFFRTLNLPGLQELVTKQKAVLGEMEDALEKNAGDIQDDYWRLVVDFRLGQIRAVQQWLELCLQTV